MASTEEPLQVPRIARTLKVSEAHLSKVLQRLSKTPLLKSVRGPRGGYMLALPPKEITLLQIWETIDGSMDPNYCLLENIDCQSAGKCIFKDLTRKIYDEVRNSLGSTRLDNVPMGIKTLD